MTVRLLLTDYQLAVVERLLDTTRTANFDQLAAAAVADARRRPPEARRRRPRPPRPQTTSRLSGVCLDALLPAASGGSLALSTGQQLRLQQVTDGQCIDLHVFELGGRSFSAARTRALYGIHPSVGAALWSTAPEVPLLSIVADTAPGHDLCFPPCSELEYERHAGISGHLGCAELHNAARALQAPVAPSTSDEVLNLWLPSAVDDQGQLCSWPAACRRGDYVDLQAERDVVVTLSTCPDDLFGSSQYEPGPVRVIVSGGATGSLAPPPERTWSAAPSWPSRPPVSALARNEVVVSLPDTELREVDKVVAGGWLGYGRAAVLRAMIFRLHESLASESPTTH
ncbi:MAG: DUF1989 domain-containing protein [Solirubrobacteraceae bacterium]